MKLNDCLKANAARRKQGDKVVKLIIETLKAVNPRGLTIKQITRKSGLGYNQVHGCVNTKLDNFVNTKWEQIPNRVHQLRRRIFLK